jgi:hypothetical protein
MLPGMVLTIALLMTALTVVVGHYGIKNKVLVKQLKKQQGKKGGQQRDNGDVDDAESGGIAMNPMVGQQQ